MEGVPETLPPSTLPVNCTEDGAAPVPNGQPRTVRARPNVAAMFGRFGR